MKNVIALILGGGQGTRLYPLTKVRSKPAVPIGGKYRLIDIPVSNCLHSHINRIFILTQFNSASLNSHIANSYRFDHFHKGFVDILAAEQSPESKDWFQGTADAVRQNLWHITDIEGIEYVLILSGDQIYKMDYSRLIKFHKKIGADITVSVLPCNREEAGSFGILKMDGDYISDFYEKPGDDKLLDSLKSTELIKGQFPKIESDKEYLASMGIYLFNIDTLVKLLDNKEHYDFGKMIIPMAIKQKKVGAYLFNGYWEDVGTVKAFHKANLDFTALHPRFDFYRTQIFTNARYLPSSKILNSKITSSTVAEGTIILDATIKNSVIGIRSRIGRKVRIENSIIFGAKRYESAKKRMSNKKSGIMNLGIGSNTVIKNAIIDHDTRIGKNCRIINSKNLENYDSDMYYIREGIIIIPKNSVIPDNTVI